MVITVTTKDKDRRATKNAFLKCDLGIVLCPQLVPSQLTEASAKEMALENKNQKSEANPNQRVKNTLKSETATLGELNQSRDILEAALQIQKMGLM